MPPAWGVSRSSWTRPCTRQWPRLRRSSWRFPTSHGSPKYHHPWIFHCEPSSYWGSPIYGSLEIPSFFRTIPWGTNRKMWKDPWGNPFGKRSTFYGGFSTVSLVYGRLPFFRSRRSILGMDQIILAYLYAMNIQHQLFCWGTEWYGRWFWVNKFSQIWQTGCSKMGPEKGGYRKLGTEREREIYIYIYVYRKISWLLYYSYLLCPWCRLQMLRSWTPFSQTVQSILLHGSENRERWKLLTWKVKLATKLRDCCSEHVVLCEVHIACKKMHVIHLEMAPCIWVFRKKWGTPFHHRFTGLSSNNESGFGTSGVVDSES